MNELSLFTGAGGGVLGTKLLGWRTVGYVEWDKYCQQVLAQRIQDGFLDEAPIFGDIDDFIESGAAKKYAGYVDVVTAGFPCQPFSVAGKRKGQDDERNKWPQTLQCIRDVRPRYALLENVPGLLNSGYFGEILSSLAQAGFDARWCVLGADDVGAPHRRKRLWILAYPKGELGNGLNDHPGISVGREQVSESGNRSWSNDVADSEHSGQSSTEVTGSIAQGGDSGSSRSQSTGQPSGRSEQYAQLADSGSSRLAYPSRGEGGEEWYGRLHPSEEEQAGQHLRGGISRCSGVRGKEDVAYPDSSRLQQGDEAMAGGSPEQPDGGSLQPGADVPHPDNPRLQGRLHDRKFDPEGRQVESDGCLTERGTGWEGSGNEYWWSTEPDVGRVAHGVASRVDRLKALGNGQVPAVAATAWLLLTDQ